jgi:acetyl-CoA acetyltransferase
MRRVDVIGEGIVPCGVYLDRTVKEMAAGVSRLALADAAVDIPDIESVFFGNALLGLITGQESARGPIALVPAGFGSIPIHNIENACATGLDALHLGWLAVASGLHDTVLVMGVEKVNLDDRAKSFAAYNGGIDPDTMFDVGAGAGSDRTTSVDRQGALASRLMTDLGVTKSHFAQLASVAHHNGRLNPIAHRQQGASYEEILNDKVVAEPITRLMLSPITDGAAAVVLSATRAGTHKHRIRIAGSRVATRPRLDDPTGRTATETVASAVFDAAGVGPEDIDVAEVHDASVAYQLMALQELGFMRPDDAVKWIETGHTALDGAFPVNTSGGLLARGHPLGATGIAQVVELCQQLRGEAGHRQIAKEGPRVALAHTSGGVIGFLSAVASAAILVRE